LQEHDVNESLQSYERVLSAVAHEQPDRPPMEWMAVTEVTEGFCHRLGAADEEELLTRIGIDFRGVYGEVDKPQSIPQKIRERYEHEGRIEVDCYGIVKVRSSQQPAGHRVYGPFFETDDLDSLQWPQPSDVAMPADEIDRITQLNERGICTIARCENPMKMAYYMRRFDDFLVDCVLEPEYAIDLLQRIGRVETARARVGVEAGARAVMIFGDFAHQSSLMFSPDTFRAVLKPVLADFTQRMRESNPDVLLFLHSDGNLTDVLDDLVECGFHAVHPIQPESMDMDAVKRRYGGRLTIFGGISVQSELPAMSSQEIRDLVRHRVETIGRSGGLIFSPTNGMLPDVPHENIIAAYEAAAGERITAP